jgi:hypothetical protein
MPRGAAAFVGEWRRLHRMLAFRIVEEYSRATRRM